MLTEILNQKQTTGQAAKAKKQAKQDQVLPDEQIFLYENLPFQADSVGEFFPVLNHIEVTNKDAKILMQQGRQAQNEDNLELAFEYFNQAVNIMVQITGPMNPEVAQYMAKMSNIQYRIGDYLLAIELQTKSIII